MATRWRRRAGGRDVPHRRSRPQRQRAHQQPRGRGNLKRGSLDETEGALQAEKLTPEAKAIITRRLGCTGGSDPFVMKAAMKGEQRLTTGWVRGNFRGDDAGKKLNETGLISMGDGDPAVAKSIAVMNEAQLGAAIDLLNPYYDQVIAVWDKPDSVQQLESLGKRVTNGEFGPMGHPLVPAVSKARASSLKAEGRMTEVRQKLAGK